MSYTTPYDVGVLLVNHSILCREETANTIVFVYGLQNPLGVPKTKWWSNTKQILNSIIHHAPLLGCLLYSLEIQEDVKHAKIKKCNTVKPSILENFDETSGGTYC